MRDDMHEVIIERPRWGHAMRHARRARRVDPKHASAHDPESLPFRMGLRRSAVLGRTTKELNENLAPFRRFLMRQVNRPWNKVWSEISANLRATNTVQQHVRDHVQDFVATNTVVKDGAVWITRRGRPTRLEEGWQELYVDPRTGILRRNKFFKRCSATRRERLAAEAGERASRMRELGPMRQLHRLNECWWEVTLAPVPETRFAPPAGLDVVIGAGMTALPAEKLYGRPDVYAVNKRQLSSAEIVRLGLKA